MHNQDPFMNQNPADDGLFNVQPGPGSGRISGNLESDEVTRSTFDPVTNQSEEQTSPEAVSETSAIAIGGVATTGQVESSAPRSLEDLFKNASEAGQEIDEDGIPRPKAPRPTAIVPPAKKPEAPKTIIEEDEDFSERNPMAPRAPKKINREPSQAAPAQEEQPQTESKPRPPHGWNLRPGHLRLTVHEEIPAIKPPDVYR